MPYDPSLLPIGERIVQHVQATLEAIAPPTYATTLTGRVRRWDGNPFEVTNGPAVAIVEGPERQDDQVGKIIRHELPIQLEIGVFGQDWSLQLHKLLADLRVALTADWTRGGLALDTKIESAEVLDSFPSGPMAVAHMDLLIRYRTLYHDPTTAQ